MDQERLSFIALHLVPGIGSKYMKQLISYCGSAQEVFRKPKTKLKTIPYMRETVIDSLRSANTFKQAEKEIRKAEKESATILILTDNAYPWRLKTIEDAPPVLFFKGNCNLNHPRIVSIVGTRQATAYGKRMVEKIIEELLPHQALILSGLAYGIDIHSHKQALKHQLPTIAVLGSGLDVVYPAAHQEFATKMMSKGGLLTENHFGTKPDAHNFPARNRIIAGMCDALIVVEAAETGGALITAEIANSYSKDVFAVPGEIGQTFSAGCNHLIKTNKASLFTSVKDLEYLMNWMVGQPGAQQAIAFRDVAQLSNEEREIVRVIQAKTEIQVDELAWKTNVPQPVLASLLLMLEFKGWVVSKPGKVYQVNQG
jgi:DNA processing protein